MYVILVALFGNLLIFSTFVSKLKFIIIPHALINKMYKSY